MPTAPISRFEEIIGDIDTFSLVLENAFQLWSGYYGIYLPDTDKYLSMPRSDQSLYTAYCKLLRMTQEGKASCQTCAMEFGKRSTATKQMIKQVCHHGLVEITFPVILEGELIASIVCGQVRLSEHNMDNLALNSLRELGSRLGYSYEKLLHYWYEVPVVTEQRIDFTISQAERIVGYITQLGSQKLELQKELRGLEAKLAEKQKHSQKGDIPGYKIFLCHSKEDKVQVRKIYDDLIEAGLAPWLDEVEILPGADWELEIRLAIRNADAFLAFLSKKSIDNQGYIHKEILIGLDMLEQMPEGKVYFIPVRLEECEVPKTKKTTMD